MQAVINGLNNAVSGANRWKFDEQSGIAPYYTHTSGNDKYPASIIMSYNDKNETTIPDSTIARRLWNEVKSFDEQACDIVLDIFSHLSRNLDDGSAWFFASKHLDNRSLAPITKKSNVSGKRWRAGVRKEDAQPISETLWKLENIWLTIHQFIDEEETSKPRRKKDGTLQRPKRKRRQYTHQGRLLTIDQRWYQNDMTDEESDTPFLKNGYAIGWHIRPGEWLKTFLETPNRQVAQLCKTLLEYDHYRQKWEKRIGRYIMFYGHMQCKGKGGALSRRIHDVLDEVSLLPDPEKIDRHTYQNTRERFERAMNRLTEDHIIDGWRYKNEFTLPYGQKLNAWLDQDIMIYIAPVKEQLDTPNSQDKQDQ